MIKKCLFLYRNGAFLIINGLFLMKKVLVFILKTLVFAQILAQNDHVFRLFVTSVTLLSPFKTLYIRYLRPKVTEVTVKMQKKYSIGGVCKNDCSYVLTIGQSDDN